ncbi:MAG: hypothetical protein K8T89_10470 [Planctomycetes bacterium]|nr:hypothetical protein [Planctomycetota bacterium]
MVLFQTILALIFRSAGRILNTAFGWATVMLFGKIPEKRQTQISIMAFGSVIWLTVVFGIAFPKLGAFLLAFAPLPKSVDPVWIRLAMLAMALLIPMGIGVLGLYLVEQAERPKSLIAKIKKVLKGYPYTLGLALTLFMMIVVAPIMKVRSLLRRWDDAHLPMMVVPNDYMDVVADIQHVLRTGGFETHRETANLMLRLPTKILTFFAGGSVDRLIADRLTILRSPRVEVLLHPSDLVIRGRSGDVARVRAILTENLTFTKAYQTWTTEANRIEDRLVAIWNEINGDQDRNTDQCMEQLHAVEHDIKAAEFSYEEWEVLFREKLSVERVLLRLMADPQNRSSIRDVEPVLH